MTSHTQPPARDDLVARLPPLTNELQKIAVNAALHAYWRAVENGLGTMRTSERSMSAAFSAGYNAVREALTSQQHTEPVAGEVGVVTYALIAPGCSTGPTESLKATALARAIRDFPPGTAVVPLVTKSSYDALAAAKDREIVAADRSAARAGQAIQLRRAETAERQRDFLKNGLNAIVNFKSDLTRAQVREAMSVLLDGAGLKAWTTEDQSPFAARADALREILADALDEHDTSHGEITDPNDPHWSVRARALKDEGGAR